MTVTKYCRDNKVTGTRRFQRIMFGAPERTIIVPPDVTIADDGAVRYPVPDGWNMPVNGILVRHVVDDLLDAGWQRSEGNTDKLLEDCYRLADADDLEAQVKRFVLRYGPLWLCCQHGCFLSRTCWNVDERIMAMQTGDDPCLWDGTEPLSAFRALGNKVKTFMEVISLIQAGNPVPREMMAGLVQQGASLENAVQILCMLTKLKSRSAVALLYGDVPQRLPRMSKEDVRAYLMPSDEDDPTVRNEWVYPLLNDQLRSAGADTVSVDFNSEGNKLVLDSGLGIAPVIWCEVRETLARKRWIVRCALCGRPCPKKRKPAVGRQTFCDEHSKNGYGSKTLHQQRKRGQLQRVA